MDTATKPFSEGSSKPFGEVSDERDRRFDNEPPLEERVMLEFEEELERLGVIARVKELLESAARCPTKIEDEDSAGKAGDLRKLARAVEQKINEAREKHNRPILNAQRSLKAKADALFAPLGDAMAKIQQSLNSFVAEQDRLRREEQRRREDEERRARETLEKENVAPEVINDVVTAAAPPPKAIVRGAYGSSVSGRTVWKHERQVAIAKLPKQILENAQVIEAVDKVIAQMVRSGTRELKGVRIYETTEATVR